MNIQLTVTLTVLVPVTVATCGIKDNNHSLFVNDEIHIFVVRQLTAPPDTRKPQFCIRRVAWSSVTLILSPQYHC